MGRNGAWVFLPPGATSSSDAADVAAVRIQRSETAEAILRDGMADLVGLARALRGKRGERFLERVGG